MDDLLDLNWSSSPQNQKVLPPAIQPRPITSNPLSFDFLAKPGGPSSNANYYSTPHLEPIPQTLPPRSTGTGSAPRSGAATPLTNTPFLPSSADAFSGLVSLPGGPGGASSLPKTMSLAERQVQMAEEKRKQAEHERQQFAAHGAFWDTLETGSHSRPLKQRSSAPFDDLLKPKPVASARPASPNAPKNILALTLAPLRPNSSNGFDNDLLSAPLSSKHAFQASYTSTPRVRTPAQDPWDFDAFSPTVDGPRPLSHGGTSGMRTPISDFELGEDEGGGGSDEDFLSGFGRAKATNPTTETAPQPVLSQLPLPRQSATSPPPHIVGRIVEMGFSPAHAREALAKTSSGMDVEAALELLLGDQNGLSTGFEADEDQVEQDRLRREQHERERRRRRRAGPSRYSVQVRSRDETDEGSQGGQATDADKILAQASEIGQSVLSKASLFWNSSKEKAMRVYEEQRKAMEAGEGGPSRTPKAPKDGRPKWMVYAAANGEEGSWEGDPPNGGFRDDDDFPTKIGGSTTNGAARSATRQHATGVTRTVVKEVAPYRSVKERADLLFAEDPKPYISAARHRKPAISSTATPRTASPVSATPLPSRRLVNATSTQIQSSANYKAKGNEHFKLGRFSEAETAYTSAIGSLPEGHLFLIPLHNNRAATRLKLGVSPQAAQDCSTVIELVGPNYHSSNEAPLPSEVAAEVKLGDALIKATVKRAQAWEMGERWRSAVEDWEKVMAYDAALLGSASISTRNLAAEGVRRSKQMLEAVDHPVKRKAAPPKASSRPSAPPPTPFDLAKSQAVTDLRKANRMADAEDEQRLALKDLVDTKLLAWKGGKETNLRALIASLDTALWDGILAGGLKVGMHELIAEKQVKIKYMKVIARLHPDKLDVKSTTLEQRMLANGAFSALNDAWQAFKNT